MNRTADKLLFTPGPLTTSSTIKQAMLHDAGSWHFEFNALVRHVRESILQIAGVSQELGYEAILLQGSGTFGVEAVFASAIPMPGKLLILANGAYGERMVQMAEHLRLDHVILRSPENALLDLGQLEHMLADDCDITHVAMVHCETTTGILNPIAEAGRIVKAAQRCFIVDAMSSFGAYPIDVGGIGVDFLVSSANKCIEGVPGFSFVVARREALVAAEGSARSLSLDLLSQLKGFEANGQFRFTPPTHAILAFVQALKELQTEGGPSGRLARYQRNQQTLVTGMTRLGFTTCLDPSLQSCIITSFRYPKDLRFDFGRFYRHLSDRGFIIYPGKITRVDSFRIGSIGHIFETDICGLLQAIKDTIDEMGFQVCDESISPVSHS